MTDELKVVLRRGDNSGFGFSIIGSNGHNGPHFIYDILENSPAAENGEVEAGDVLLKVNDISVDRFTTKEVLKCLRLSTDLCTLILKRDPKLKARIKEQLAHTTSPHYYEIDSPNIYDYSNRKNSITNNSNNSTPTSSRVVGGPTTSPALRYKSPTHQPLHQRQVSSSGIATSTTPTATTISNTSHSTIASSNHSRSSSGSSAKIHITGGNGGNGAGGGAAGIGCDLGNAGITTTGSSTSSTCRPSRIPTPLKAVAQKPPVQHSPQHKRPKPSQIPTKATAGGVIIGSPTSASSTNGSGSAFNIAAPLQHSNSYSGGGGSGTSTRFQSRDKDFDPEPNSAPPQPAKTPRFEAYMMTGDLILNLSRTPQSSNLLPAYTKKIDSLRDSPNRLATATSNIGRANGALAPRASGESSPTSSSSIESPTHTHTASSGDSLHISKAKRKQQQYRHQQQQDRDSINNSYNNSNSGGGGGGEIGAGAAATAAACDRQYRKDSLTNDTLLLCEELERDEDYDYDEGEELEEDNKENRQQRYHHQQQQQRYRKQQQQHRQRNRYEYYLNDEEKQQQSQESQQQQQQQQHYEYEEDDDIEDLENEEDQTHYGITNIETYNSAEIADETSDRQCLVMNYGDDYDDDYDIRNDDGNIGEDEYSTNNSLTSGTGAKQRLRLIKQRAAKYKTGSSRQQTAASGSDSIDFAYSREQQYPHQQQQQQQQLQYAHTSTHHKTGTQHITNSGNSSSSSTTVRSDGISGGIDETSFSVPTSPTSLSAPLLDKETANSVPTSPDPSSIAGGAIGNSSAIGSAAGGGGGHDSVGVVRRHNGHIVRKCDSAGFRTSKSEDHLQQIQREGAAAVIPIDIDEDVNSSLNTLLDTRHDSDDSQASNRDRIVWTYNAPLQPHQIQQIQQQQQMQQQQQQMHQQQMQQQQQHQQQQYGNNSNNQSPNNSNSQTNSHSHTHSSHSHSHSSSISSSPQHSAGSPASPTSVSSSVMSSSGSKGALGIGVGNSINGQQQQQQQQNLLQQQHGGGGGGNICGTSTGGMVLSDPSDSDSTILVSDAAAQRQQQQHQHQQQQQNHQTQQKQSEHKLVIQVRGIDSNNTSPRSNYSDFKDSEDELMTITEDTPVTTALQMQGQMIGNDNNGRDSSPPVSDDGSDVESLHSYHYSPKAVDMPSAIRLAKRLYSLDGFKKSDVSRHLSKNNDFSRAVADEYLKYFNFDKKTLDQSLREFLQQFSLSGETQERERVLVHFSKRFLDCNPGSFNSQDAVHTLTCAIMLLNSDLHGQNISRKMTCAEFVENLAELNDGENFPKDVLKYLYQAIKTQPLQWALDDESPDLQKQRNENNGSGTGTGSGNIVIGQNPFLDIPESNTAVEYKKGYVMRKCCYDANYKKTPFGKRSWKMFYCTLRDLVLFLHKDEHGFRKSQMSDNLHNAIRIHHALATKATDYTKKQHVFRLQTADQAEYLFQTSDSKELQSWIETINFVCAAYSAPPIEGGVGSQKRFQRPLLPSAHTKLLIKEQLESHEQQLTQLENALMEHKKGPIPTKGLPLQNYKEKENYMQYELRRYIAYVAILNAKMLADQQQFEQQQQQTPQSTNDEESDTFPVGGNINKGQQPQQQQPIQSNSINLQQQQQPPQQQQQSQPNQQSSTRKKEKKK